MVFAEESWPGFVDGLLRGGGSKRLERAVHRLLRAPGAQMPQLGGLLVARFLADVEDLLRSLVDDVIIHADDDLFFLLDRALVGVAGLGDLLLREAVLDGLHHAAHRVQLAEILEGAVFHVPGQPLDEVGAAQRIDRVGNAGFIREDLLRAQRDARRVLGGKREGFVKAIRVQRLRAAEDRRKRLDGDARDVVLRLLRGERNAGGLGVKAHPGGARILRAEALGHRAIPDAARRTIFSDLFEEVVMRVEEEREAWCEVIDGESAAERPLDVLDPIVEGEGEFLQRRRTGFADVVSGDGDGIEARRVKGAELEGVDHQPHRRCWRIDVLLLCDVLLQDVVLQRARDLLPVCALLLRDDEIHGPQYGRGRVNRHRDGDLFKIDAGEEDLHIFE